MILGFGAIGGGITGRRLDEDVENVVVLDDENVDNGWGKLDVEGRTWK